MQKILEALREKQNKTKQNMGSIRQDHNPRED